MTPIHRLIRDTIRGIQPYDTTETMHQIDALTWINAGAPLFRVSKPDTPAKHLVSYFVLYDEERHKILLIDHRKSRLWLPTGGHVEPDEDPQTTVSREAMEELNIPADFTTTFAENPLFITVTRTKGAGSHTDVSLWYIIRGDSTARLNYDTDEIQDYRWLTPKEVLLQDIGTLDPHMHRFTNKMLQSLR